MSSEFDPTAILLVLGLLFLVGLAADLLGRFTFLPRVTLLLLGGLAIGPAGFSLLPDHFLDTWFPALTSIALALIGFLLGHQISIKALRKRGSVVLHISVFEALGAALAVGSTLLLFGADPIVAILLAGIAPATAPAATYDVVHEIGATGEFPDTLLSVVAIDDVWGLLLFALMAATATVMNGEAGVAGGITTGLLEIFGSVALGGVLGIPMAYLTGRIRSGEPTLAEALGLILLSAGIAQWLELSPILTAMAMGSVVASLAKHHDRPFHAIEGVEWPFMILFFVLAGASLDPGALSLVSGIAVLYILSRCIGIYVGVRLGGHLSGADRSLRKWLGLALFPQAGVAIGMALLASQRFPEFASIILPVVLASTVFLEIVAPVLSRRAIIAASSSSGGTQE